MASSSTVPPLHLLLLPPAPWPATSETLRSAYGTTIVAILKQLSWESRKGTTGTRLDISLPVPYLLEHQNTERRKLFPTVQALLAGVYKLVCVIAAKENIDVEDSEGIDVRVLLLAYPGAANAAPVGGDVKPSGSIGPVIDLPTLARSGRPWNYIIAVEGKQGDEILREFLVNQDSHVRIQRVPGGHVQASEEKLKITLDEPDDSESFGQHNSMAVGGTWDHIHIGHKLLLTMFAFMLPLPTTGASEETLCLTIGIAGDALLVDKRFPDLLESWSDRQNSASSFLLSIMDFRPQTSKSSPAIPRNELTGPGPNGHAIDETLSNITFKYVEISDPFGPTIMDESISALVLSAETRAGGKAVNEKRVEKGWMELEIFEVDVLDAEEEPGEDGKVKERFANKLSSTGIREGLRRKAQARVEV